MLKSKNRLKNQPPIFLVKGHSHNKNIWAILPLDFEGKRQKNPGCNKTQIAGIWVECWNINNDCTQHHTVTIWQNSKVCWISEGAPDIQMGPPKDSPQMRISGGSDKGECASKVCKFLGQKTECGLSKILSSGREWCHKCEEIGERFFHISDRPSGYCIIGIIGDYCDSTC